jgi:hypothetical protein
LEKFLFFSRRSLSVVLRLTFLTARWISLLDYAVLLPFVSAPGRGNRNVVIADDRECFGERAGIR